MKLTWMSPILVASLVGGPAWAQNSDGCATDLECKGDRICVDGTCEDPAGVSNPAPSDNAPDLGFDNSAAPKVAAGRGTGWTLVAGILGFAAAGAVGALGTASAVTEDDRDTSLPFGIAATVAGAVMIPIAAAGAGSGSVRGSTGLKVVGWISYGLFLTNALVLVGLGAADVGDGELVAPIVSTTALGAVSGIMFGIDGLAANSKSKAMARDDGELRWSPLITIAAARDRRRQAVPTVGVGATF